MEQTEHWSPDYLNAVDIRIPEAFCMPRKQDFNFFKPFSFGRLIRIL